MDPLLIGLIGTVCGGAGLKVVEGLFNRASRKDDTAIQMRKELREDIASLKKELKEESQESEEWKAKYYEAKYSAVIANHKVDKVIDVVDEIHEEANLKEDLGELMHPDK